MAIFNYGTASALVFPQLFFPGSEAMPTAPVGEDAVLLATAMVLPEHAGGGLGRMLMQSVVKDLYDGLNSLADRLSTTQMETSERLRSTVSQAGIDAVLPAIGAWAGAVGNRVGTGQSRTCRRIEPVGERCPGAVPRVR